jgi:hypothetical protein
MRLNVEIRQAKTGPAVIAERLAVEFEASHIEASGSSSDARPIFLRIATSDGHAETPEAAASVFALLTIEEGDALIEALTAATRKAKREAGPGLPHLFVSRAERAPE